MKLPKPCVVCGDLNTDMDHIKTQGSGGSDESFNLWPLCRKHHIEKHQLGMQTFLYRYPAAEKILKEKGWHVINEFGQWKLRRTNEKE